MELLFYYKDFLRSEDLDGDPVLVKLLLIASKSDN